MQVKAVNTCFVDGTYREAGEQFEYTGPKNDNLEPVQAKKQATQKQGDEAAE